MMAAALAGARTRPAVQIKSRGMKEALQLWDQVLRYNTPEQDTKVYCGVWEDAFAQVQLSCQDGDAELASLMLIQLCCIQPAAVMVHVMSTRSLV